MANRRNFSCAVCKAPCELCEVYVTKHGRTWALLVPICTAEKCLEKNAVASAT